MKKISHKVHQMVSNINRRKLSNNTQKVLLALISADGEWISRNSLRIPSASSRIRDLRTPKFGSFDIECASANELAKRTSGKIKNPTYYRLKPQSVTAEKISQLFADMI